MAFASQHECPSLVPIPMTATVPRNAFRDKGKAADMPSERHCLSALHLAMLPFKNSQECHRGLAPPPSCG